MAGLCRSGSSLLHKASAGAEPPRREALQLLGVDNPGPLKRVPGSLVKNSGPTDSEIFLRREFPENSEAQESSKTIVPGMTDSPGLLPVGCAVRNTEAVVWAGITLKSRKCTRTFLPTPRLPSSPARVATHPPVAAQGPHRTPEPGPGPGSEAA